MKAKKIILTLFIIGCLNIIHLSAKPIQVIFKYKFSHIQTGYDHTCRLKVYLDGSLIGTSPSHLESTPSTYTVQFEQGYHQLRAVMETSYESNWEEHTIINDYSIDCVYEVAMAFAKPKTLIKIDFDINVGAIVNGKFGGEKVKKQK